MKSFSSLLIVGLAIGLSNAENPFQGSFKLQRSDNFKAYLEALRVPKVLVALAVASKPTVTYSRNCPNSSPLNDPNCVWSIKTAVPLVKEATTQFRLGQPVKSTSLDGRKISSVYTVSPDNSLVEVQTTESSGLQTTITRRVNGNNINIDLAVGGVRASSIFRRV